MTPKYRIPRKLKKQYKKLWEQINKKLYVIKKTISFDVWPNSGGRKVWGCITRPKNEI